MKELIGIDYLLVRQLRREGKWAESEMLLNEFHKNIQKNKKQQLREIRNQDGKIARTIKKKYGKCSYDVYCNEPAIKGRKCCKKHIRKR